MARSLAYLQTLCHLMQGHCLESTQLDEIVHVLVEYFLVLPSDLS